MSKYPLIEGECGCSKCNGFVTLIENSHLQCVNCGTILFLKDRWEYTRQILSSSAYMSDKTIREQIKRRNLDDNEKKIAFQMTSTELKQFPLIMCDNCLTIHRHDQNREKCPFCNDYYNPLELFSQQYDEFIMSKQYRIQLEDWGWI